MYYICTCPYTDPTSTGLLSGKTSESTLGLQGLCMSSQFQPQQSLLTTCPRCCSISGLEGFLLGPNGGSNMLTGCLRIGEIQFGNDGSDGNAGRILRTYLTVTASRVFHFEGNK